MTSRLLLPCVLLALSVPSMPVRAADASAPQGGSLFVYDVGFTLVNELRRVTLERGANEVVFRKLPAQLEPDTASLSVLAGGPKLEPGEHRFEYDLSDPGRLFDRYLGQAVVVRSQGRAVGGTLLAAPRADVAGAPMPLVLAPADQPDLFVVSPAQIGDVTFPGARQSAFVEPTLLWNVTSEQEGLQNVRLAYVAEGLSWGAAYEIMVQPGGRSAQFSSRVHVRNESGGAFENMRVKLIATEKGAAGPALGAAGTRARAEGAIPQRYAYGAGEPSAERVVAGLAPEHTYDLARPLSIAHGQTKYLQFAVQQALPVSRFYVYDGVRFDRFQRNRRNDWNYGTEYRTAVETHLEYNNARDAGLGIDLPPGHVRVYQRKDDDSIEYLGEDLMAASVPGKPAHVLLGPARGLQGERERTGYTEVRPLHEYEETFEIRLANFTTETVEIRVVEHLYRWTEYEIVKADADYQPAGAQTIEFRPTLKPGGKKTIHYTVRYRW